MSTPGVASRSTSIRRNPAVVAQRVRGELVLVHLETNEIFDLTATAARLWDLLEGRTAPDELIDALLCEYDVARDRLAADVERTLHFLAGHRLVLIDPR